MTWQDPGGNPGAGGGSGRDDPSLDQTRTNWEPPAPDVASPTGPATPPTPPGPPAVPPSAPGTWGTEGLGTTPPHGGGYPPGAPPPGMAWAPPDPGFAATNAAGLRFADVGPRFVAWLVDVLLLAIVNGLIGAVLWALLSPDIDWEAFLRQRSTAFTPVAVGDLVLYGLVTTVIGAAIDFVYFAFLWSSEARATLGMRLMRLQIGNAADGRTLEMPQAARRWLAMGSWLSLGGLLPVLGGLVGLAQLGWYIVLLVTTGSSPTRQGIHDRFAETAVVQRGEAPNAVLIGCLVVAAFFAVLTVVAFVALIFLGSQVSEILEQMSPRP